MFRLVFVSFVIYLRNPYLESLVFQGVQVGHTLRGVMRMCTARQLRGSPGMPHKIFVHIRPLKRGASRAFERVRDGLWHTSNVPDGIRPVRESALSL